MTPEQKQVILGLMHIPNGPPTSKPEDVLRVFGATDGVTLGLELLAGAVERRDSEEVEYALLVCQTFGFAEGDLPLLLDLASADWHVKHEDVVWYLGGYQSPAVVDALYHATQWVPDYLAFDENRALARKAIWELGKQPGDKARQALKRLAHSKDELLSNEAKQQLER